MKRIVFAVLLAVMSMPAFAARPDKTLVCHVGSEDGALKVDLVHVPANANQLGNPGA